MLDQAFSKVEQACLVIHREDGYGKSALATFSQDYLCARYLSSEAETSLGSAQESGNSIAVQFQ